MIVQLSITRTPQHDYKIVMQSTERIELTLIYNLKDMMTLLNDQLPKLVPVDEAHSSSWRSSGRG